MNKQRVYDLFIQFLHRREEYENETNAFFLEKLRSEISKGNVSKICSKLTSNGWIRKSQLSDNKKEIYFRLTPTGKKLFALHEDQHEIIQRKFIRLLDRYDETEVEFMKRVLTDAIDCLGEFP